MFNNEKLPKISWKIFILITLLEVFFLSYLAFNSYGTNDVKVVSDWTQSYFTKDFWIGFSDSSTYPHLVNEVFYLAGIITFKILKYSIQSQIFVFFYKFFAIISLLIIQIIFFFKSRSNIKKIFSSLFLLNPAVILHTPILGYMGAYYFLFLTASVYFLDKINSINKSERLNIIYPVGLIVALLLGTFTKWQFLIYLLVLGIFSLLTLAKKRLFKESAYGVLISIFILLTTFLVVPSKYNFSQRIEGEQKAFSRIMNESFVVANISNTWQLVNFYTNTCHQEVNVECFEKLDEFVKYWDNSELKNTGRNYFYLILGTFYLYSIYKLKNSLKSEVVLKVISLLLWTNIIYVGFATGVHENHFMPAIMLSFYLFLVKPGRFTFLNYIFISFYNFANLNYFYSFGIGGINGFSFSVNNQYINISLVLSFIFIIYIFCLTRRLGRSEDSSLGLT